MKTLQEENHPDFDLSSPPLSLLVPLLVLILAVVTLQPDLTFPALSSKHQAILSAMEAFPDNGIIPKRPPPDFAP